ncbi:MAG TPA: thymidine phosphorylase [Candidatus Poseidoniales archaeon]|nr:MAG: thymidine phosphorylase [Euryarchaeota archaeon]HIG38870.1 thymidine phosphorylase [Candidatus Poseidoniales archaeon]HIL43647.1 thymidine phosphorylase [Candidatus Poseidoniales archaeon]
MSKVIQDLVQGVVDGSLSDDELTDWLRGVYDEGLTESETIALTEAMRDSGEILEWDSEISKLIVDKHSTGGVGDKVSLVLAPALAACGLMVPMISGRGLGHTGGTLDKLESIPGLRVEMNSEGIRQQVESIGVAMVGQSDALVPADRRMYALRDVTGTVASIPLITSSILSKKAAEGLSAMVLDVKFGRAAFMVEREQAVELARSMVGAANGMGIRTTAVLTSMQHPLGCAIGNSLEIFESVETLCGSGPEDLEELVCVQGGLLLHATGLVEDPQTGAVMIHDSLQDGSAFERFRLLVEAQGGDVSIFDSDASLMRGLGLMDSNLNTTELSVGTTGWVEDIDAMAIARVCSGLGAGRARLGDSVDRAVGAILEVQVGDYLEKGEPWMVLYHRDEVDRGTIEEMLGSITLSDEEVEVGSRIEEMFD